MNARGFLIILLVLALVAGAGALLVLRGGADEPSPTSAPRGGESPEAPVVLPQPTDAPGQLTVPGAGASAPAAVGIDTSGSPSVVVGRAVDRTGRGLSGARVTTFSRDDDPPFRTRHELAVTETTGADGRFRLLALPVGPDLGVEIVDDDHAPTVREPFRARRAADVDLGEIILDDGFELHGTVFGAQSEPLAGATVTIVDVTAHAGRGSDDPLRSTLSDANGDYRFAHLGPRQYDIEASAAGHGTTGVVLSMIFGGMPSEWRQDFRLEVADSSLGGWIVGPDEKGVADTPFVITRQPAQGNSYFLRKGRTAADGGFQFPELPAGVYQMDIQSSTHYFDRPADVQAGRTDLLVRAQAALEVHGRVVGDEPLAGFHLTIQPDGRTGAGLLASAPHARDLPGDSFVVGGLRPGSYRFEVLAPGYAPTASSDIIIAPGQEWTEVLVELLRGGTITGRLQPAQAGARIELREPDWDPAGPIESTFPTAPAHGLVTKSADDGSFRLENVPPETYVLTARPAGAPPIHVRDVLTEDRQTTDVGTLAVELGATLFGNVVGPDGRVSQGVRVTASSANHQAQVTSDAQGAFRLEALPPGEYDLSATPGSLWEALRFQASAHVRLEAGKELGVELALVERSQALPR